MKKFGELIKNDNLYVIIVGKIKIEIKKAYVYKIDDNKDIVFSFPNRISEDIATIWPPKNTTICSPEFTPFYNRYFTTSLEEAEDIRKKIYADKIKKVEDKIKKLENDIQNAKILKCKLENITK